MLEQKIDHLLILINIFMCQIVSIVFGNLKFIHQELLILILKNATLEVVY